jgi:hypothetical protein
MKLGRLWQPRNPAFWLMIAVNLLSTVLAWVVRNYSLGTLASLVIAAFAIGNVVIGLRLMWLLVRDEPPPT